MKQTKIVASISDRRCDPSFIRSLFEAGMNVVRMNTAHANEDGIKQIIKSNVFTYFNLVFVVLAGLLIFVGSFKELTFMILVVANTFIGIFQEIRSKRTLDKLKLMKMPRARAIRNGEEVQVQVADLVIDDVVVLRAGNQIPADAKVIEGSIQVNEALLTGEAEEISKNKGDSLLSGSYVVSGECLAVLTAVGKDAYISKLTLEATKSGAHEDSEMIISLDKLVKVIGIVIIPVGIVMMIQQMVVLDMKLQESVISMVAAVLGMIPEGLYITASVAMVVSAIKLARRDVLVQNLKCIEALARVDVLCVDKTGTITENEMKVDSFVPANRRIHEEDVSRLIGSFVAAQTADNATMEALKEYFVDTGDWEVVKVCPFSSRYKYSGVCFLGGNYDFATYQTHSEDYPNYDRGLFSLYRRTILAITWDLFCSVEIELRIFKPTSPLILREDFIYGRFA